MEKASKRNLIIMVVLMSLMIVGSIIFGKIRKAERVLDRVDKATAVVEKVMPTEDEAKANIELAKQATAENANTAKEKMEETRQKFNGALDAIKDRGVTLHVPPKDEN